MKESFAEKVRQAARRIGEGGSRFSLEELSEAAGIDSYDDRRRMRTTVKDFCRTGEMERAADQGVYFYRGKRQGKPQKQQVILDLLKMRRSVTVEDLQELAGVSADYAQERLSMLVRREVVRRHENGKYLLIRTPEERDVRNEEKAERLRGIRLKKKQEALAALGEARRALARVEELIVDMGESTTECDDGLTNRTSENHVD